MTALFATIRKELQLLLHDIYGLMLLFVMPVLFILIMGLALQEPLSRHDQPKKILALLSTDSAGPQTSPVMALLQQQTAFTWQVVGRQDATERISRDEAAFLLSLREQYGAVQADILVAPGTNRLTEALFTTTVTAVLGRQQMDALLQGMHIGNGQPADPVRVHYRYASEQGGKRPTSVQQSVPAWLVFAMFFSVVPLANTLISERQQGTLRRIGTLPVSPYLPVMGKFIPYFLINQIQVLLMLAVGIYLMPALGADRLTPGDSYSALALMATSLSVAALGYGLLIAVLARTTDQAATLGGIGNILLAAIGGVMVPRFIMPDTMQTLAGFSPMAWGMEGLLDLFLRNGQVADVLPEASALLLFGGVGLVLAIVLSRHRY